MGRPRNKGGGVPPPLRPKDLSALRQRHREGPQNGNHPPREANGNGDVDVDLVVQDNNNVGPGPLRRSRGPSPHQYITAFAVFGVVAMTVGFGDWLLPWGYPVVPSSGHRLQYAGIDPSNDVLQLRHGRLRRIVERSDLTTAQIAAGRVPRPLLLKAPETILFDAKDNMLIMTEESQLVMLDDFRQPDDKSVTNATTFGVVMASAAYLRDLGPGRPLGGAFGYGKFANTLYVADAILGLTRIRNYKDPSSKVEIVASSIVASDDGDINKSSKGRKEQQRRQRRFKYVDDVVVGPQSNKVYFTDATNVAPDRIFRHDARHQTRGATWTWDTLHGSKVDLLVGRGEGRVYEYDPFTDQTRELGRGLRFANGIAVDPNENFLVVAETFGPRIQRYWLRGDKAGQWEVLVDDHQLPGYPDGVDCEPTGTTCYAVLPSSIVPAHKILSRLPSWLDRLLRTVLLTLPRQLAPPTEPYAGVVVINTETGATSLLQDPTGRDVSLLCGVTYHKGKLYLGSVHNSYVAVYDLGKSVK